jgi:curved DNA-binding protein CbpA
VFGFKETARLTESLIKERHRELVRRHHPDRGGSTARMAVINDARDILMASL